MDKVFVVTYPESGWDCVIAVYTGYDTEEEVRKLLDEEAERDTEGEFVIHRVYNINTKSRN